MLEIGKVYRLPQKQLKSTDIVDGLPNFYYETNTPGFGFAFQRGIHKVKEIKTISGKKRCPLIIISSSPTKAGSESIIFQKMF